MYKVELEASYFGSQRSIQMQTVPCMPPLQLLQKLTPPPPSGGKPCPLSKKKASKKDSQKPSHPTVTPTPTPQKESTPVSDVPQVRFYCTFGSCSKNFSRKSDLKRHSGIHQDITFNCATCDKTFTLKKNLALHMGTHSGESQHVCHVCGKSLSSKLALQGHLEFHTGEKPHKCSNEGCKKDYNSKQALVRHMLSCGKTKIQRNVFACPKCPMLLSTRDALKYHLGNIHTDRGSFVCPKCGKHLNSRGAFSKHHCAGG